MTIKYASIECPECHGKGLSGGYGLACGERGCQVAVMSCRACRGTGEVDLDYPERKAKAEELRTERMARDLSARERARELGMSAVDYSRLEHPVSTLGRIGGVL